jgi:hypothetical protein
VTSECAAHVLDRLEPDPVAPGSGAAGEAGSFSWDNGLIAMGFIILTSMANAAVSEWHIQAAIAAEYAKARRRSN